MEKFAEYEGGQLGEAARGEDGVDPAAGAAAGDLDQGGGRRKDDQLWPHLLQVTA